MAGSLGVITDAVVEALNDAVIAARVCECDCFARLRRDPKPRRFSSCQRTIKTGTRL
jgi:hypothetical protein